MNDVFRALDALAPLQLLGLGALALGLVYMAAATVDAFLMRRAQEFKADHPMRTRVGMNIRGRRPMTPASRITREAPRMTDDLRVTATRPARLLHAGAAPRAVLTTYRAGAALRYRLSFPTLVDGVDCAYGDPEKLRAFAERRGWQVDDRTRAAA